MAHVVIPSDSYMGHENIASKYRKVSKSRHCHWGKSLYRVNRDTQRLSRRCGLPLQPSFTGERPQYERSRL
jgi:hypothetical protein